jgi:hypothetical protein
MPNHINIYMKTRVNVGGLLPVPIPVLEVNRASDKSIDLQLRDYSDDKLVIDLTGHDIAFVVREEKYNPTVVLTKQTGDGGITVESAVEGKINVNFTAEELDLPETDYWYEINMIDASNNVTIQPLGKFRVIR